ncbi:hypothetical protein FDZ71_14615 [bacterium]|nr:MAG: hypothetical protein FDZ71_14615 [bacterium]
MKLTQKVLTAALLAAIAASPLPLWGAEPIGDQLSGAVVLTEVEKAALEPPLAQYSGLGGGSEPLRELIEECGRYGCRGECMGQMLALANEGMKAGKKDSEAVESIRKALKSVADYSKGRGVEPTPEEIARAVRANISKTPAPVTR